MIIRINKNTPKSEIVKKLASLEQKVSKLDLKKYSGILSEKIDGLEYQKQIRSEWD
jgi:hypothetical protein